MESSNGIYKNTVQITNGDVIIKKELFWIQNQKQFHDFAKLFSFAKILE